MLNLFRGLWFRAGMMDFAKIIAYAAVVWLMVVFGLLIIKP